jgi:lysophospholipase L1-like esterase
MIRYTLALALALPVVALAQDSGTNLSRFAGENAALGAPARGEERVVFMGDSITQGWSVASPEYFEGKPYIERGIGGETTTQMLARFRADVVDLEPAAVVILAGTNDIAGNQGPTTNKMIEDNLASMAEIATANDIRVILSSVLPVYDYPWRPGLEPAQRIVALNNWIEDYAEEHDHVYLDYYWELVDERGGMADPYTTDGVHVSKAGYEIMQGLAEAAIAESLDRDPPKDDDSGFGFEPIQGCASNVRLRSRRGDCD